MTTDGEFWMRKKMAERLLEAFEGSENVSGIISGILDAMGYDGLFNPDGECGCETGDLFPCTCNENLNGCEPAYRFDCYRCSGWSENDGDCAKGNCEWDVLFTTNPEHCTPDYFEEKR